MVGVPSTMFSCPQHNPLPTVLPIESGMTAKLATVRELFEHRRLDCGKQRGYATSPG